MHFIPDPFSGSATGAADTTICVLIQNLHPLRQTGFGFKQQIFVSPQLHKVCAIKSGTFVTASA